MIRRTLREEIGRLFRPGQIRYDERMDRHCSFRTGGPADAFVHVRTARELAALLSLLRRDGTDYFILGRGTNLLIGDGGYRGVVITAFPPSGAGNAALTASEPGASEAEKNGLPASGAESSVMPVSRAESSAMPVSGTEPDGTEGPFLLSEVRVMGDGRILAGAGATLHEAAAAAAEQGLSGLEFASGIPGTVGGALVMNAGAYGGEISQVARTVSCMMPDGSVRVLTGEEMEFDYRTSILRRLPMAALWAEFVLRPDDPGKIRARIRDFAARRREKQPLEFPSAGSTFKRPDGYFAGRLIMEAGLGGFRIGDAQVSEKHCGFVINRGAATSSQIRSLIEEVQRRVLEDSGIALEREVIFLGEF